MPKIKTIKEILKGLDEVWFKAWRADKTGEETDDHLGDIIYVAFEEKELHDYIKTQISLLLEEQAKELLIRRKEEKIETAKATDWAVRKQLLGEIETLIAEEMIIANKEGQPTSRLTSLAVKLKNLTQREV